MKGLEKKYYELTVSKISKTKDVVRNIKKKQYKYIKLSFDVEEMDIFLEILKLDFIEEIQMHDGFVLVPSKKMLFIESIDSVHIYMRFEQILHLCRCVITHLRIGEIDYTYELDLPAFRETKLEHIQIDSIVNETNKVLTRDLLIASHETLKELHMPSPFLYLNGARFLELHTVTSTTRDSHVMNPIFAFHFPRIHTVTFKQEISPCYIDADGHMNPGYMPILYYYVRCNRLKLTGMEIAKRYFKRALGKYVTHMIVNEISRILPFEWQGAVKRRLARTFTGCNFNINLGLMNYISTAALKLDTIRKGVGIKQKTEKKLRKELEKAKQERKRGEREITELEIQMLTRVKFQKSE